MLIGPIYISFAPPFFIFAGVMLSLILWVWIRRSKKSFIPHSHGILTKKNRGKILRAAHIAIFLLSAISLLLLLFASLNPKSAQTINVNHTARRICIVFDASGSMTIGFDDTSSPLPSYEKTRMGQAGIFIRKFVEKRQGDEFALVFFDSEQYVSRDFTYDASQITDVLAPATLVGVLNIEGVLESVRVKQDAESRGTQAVRGLEFAKDFIISHKDYTGNEVIVYVGDLTLDVGTLDTQTPKKLTSLREDYGIKTYAVAVVSDYIEKDEEEKEKIARQKLDLFKNSGIPVYRVDDTRKIEQIADRLASDLPPSLSEEKILTKTSFAPWLIVSSFLFTCIALILNEKFPKVP